MVRHKMMLDTTAVSGFFRGNEEIKNKLESADDIFVNPVVIGELMAGFMMGDSERRNREILSAFLSSPHIKVVDIDEETSERYGAIVSSLRKSGTPIPTNDIWMAASAMQHGLNLLTTDSHYLKVPQVIVEFCGQS